MKLTQKRRTFEAD